jgi:hypothetical protein
MWALSLIFSMVRCKGFSNAGASCGLSRLAARSRNRVRDVRLAVDAFCSQAIVRPAKNPEILWPGAAPSTFRRLMIELEEAPSIGAPPVVRYERAPPSVARHHFTASGTRHLRVLRRPRLLLGSTGSSLLFLLQFGDEEIHRALKDDGEITLWIRVEHQVAGEFEFLSHGAARRELHEEPVLRQRIDVSPRCRGWCPSEDPFRGARHALRRRY